MNGILNVYKEKGYTSFDVVAKLRGICRQKKIGHTGTLDPDAQGALPVCLGTATKACSLLTDKDKEYEAVLLLGKETDTQDITGKVLRECGVTCSEAEILEAAETFVGEYSQVPPMYSALKVNGKKLCDLARAGIEVERKPRIVQIYDLSALSVDLPRVKIRVHCSKGTYIRTLCDDIGKKLGCGGCMESLVRTRSGIFEASDALKLSDIQKLAGLGQLKERLIGTDQLFLAYPPAQAREEYEKLLLNGNRLPRRAFYIEANAAKTNCEKLRVYYKGEFIGIYELEEARREYKPFKLFFK